MNIWIITSETKFCIEIRIILSWSEKKFIYFVYFRNDKNSLYTTVIKVPWMSRFYSQKMRSLFILMQTFLFRLWCLFFSIDLSYFRHTTIAWISRKFEKFFFQFVFMSNANSYRQDFPSMKIKWTLSESFP